MKMANLKDLKQAINAARAVISLTKLIIGDELSKKIAEISPPDLREGWESIRANKWMTSGVMNAFSKLVKFQNKRSISL